MNAPGSVHVSVMLGEVLEWLAPRPGAVIVDGTLGGGGHTRALAERVAPDGLIIGLDRDPAATAQASERLAGLPIKVATANYADLRSVLAEIGIDAVDGVLLDLGLSSDQLADAARGFSFSAEGPLDLRFDPSEGEPAWRLLERLDPERLANLIFEYGEERFSRRIARAVVERRATRQPFTARGLAELVRRALPPPRRRERGERIDSATRTFQALRIAVNDELGALERLLAELPAVLRPGGRAAIISFHSLEDRLVKHAFRESAQLEPLTKKPIRPTSAEVERNPRARSAKLRVAQRLP